MSGASIVQRSSARVPRHTAPSCALTDWAVGRLGTFLLLCVIGCSGEPSANALTDAGQDAESIRVTEPEEVPLVVGDGWSWVRGEDDPYHHLNTLEAECLVDPFQPEYDGVEIDTNECSHVTLVQPLMTDVREGQSLRVIAWHAQLFSPTEEPAVGHMTLAIGNEEIWSVERPIPGPAFSWDFRVQVPANASAGTPIFFHVRNHGGNSWNLNSLTALTE